MPEDVKGLIEEAREYRQNALAFLERLAIDPDLADWLEHFVVDRFTDALEKLSRPSQEDGAYAGSSEAACTFYPGEDQLELREAFRRGAAHAVASHPMGEWSEEDVERAARARYASRPIQNRNGGSTRLAWDDLGEDWQRDECEAMRAALSNLPHDGSGTHKPPIPKGFHLVPEEPTEEMISAAIEACAAAPVRVIPPAKFTDEEVRESRRSILRATVDWQTALRAAISSSPVPDSQEPKS